MANSKGRWQTFLLLFVTPLASCALHHQMVQLSPGGWCPDRPQASEVRFSPAEINRTDGADLTWYTHPSVRDGAENAAWCETAGPPTVFPDPHPKLSSTAPDTLTVVAWNVLIGGGDLREFVREELALSCEVGGPRPLEGFTPFLLLIQEAHQRSSLVPPVPENAPVPWEINPEQRAPDAPDILGVAESCGLSLVYVPSARNGSKSEEGQGEDKGNAILSTFPLREAVAIELPFEAGRKVAAGASFDVGLPGSPLRVVSVHLDVASTLLRTLKTGNRTRERQVAGLLEAMDLHGWGAGPAVVGGDFNTWSSRDAALKVMLLSHPDSPPITWETSMGPFPADHLFFRADREGTFALVPNSYRTIQGLYGSDHQARMFRLSLKR